MTQLLIWLLAFPLVAALCVAVYARTTQSANIGRLNRGYTIVYALGTVILLAMYFVRYV